MKNSTALVPLDHGGPVDWPFEAFPNSDVDASIIDRFEVIANRFPDRLAIQDQSTSLTYRELQTKVAKISAAVAKARMGRAGPIGILLEPDARYAAAMLGVLTAGAAYAALDPRHPAERNLAIIEHAGICVVVSAGVLAKETALILSSSSSPVPVIDADALVDEQMQPLDIRPAATDLAYILFTSGSAGIPKGVPHSHRDILHYMLQYTNALHISSEDRLTLLHPPNLSAGTRDIYAALLNGASLHILPAADLLQSGLVREIEARRITIYHSVPTLVRRLSEELETNEQFEGVRVACLSSDRVEWSDIEACRETFSGNVHVYVSLASTETHVRCHWFVDDALRQTTLRPPVGRPLPDRELLIVDEKRALVADGEIGEILIRSRYVARGYWNDPGLYADKFEIDATDSSQVIFRTGDLGRRRTDGLIEFVGREDDLIKLHGNRIELAEVESALLATQDVSDGAVVVRYSKNGTPLAVVAYVVPRPESGAVQPRHLQSRLALRLPSHMIPSQIMLIDKIPRLPSLKIDRHELARLDKLRIEAQPGYDDGSLAHEVINIFETLLGRTGAALNDSVASLGGDSLQEMNVVAEVERRFAVIIPDSIIQQRPTISEILSFIDGRGASRATGSSGLAAQDVPPLIAVSRQKPLPLSSFQLRAWLGSQTAEGLAAYVKADVRAIYGPLDRDVFCASLNYIAGRHEILRTTFSVVDGQPVQTVHPPAEVPLVFHDYINQPDARERAWSVLEHEASEAVDLERGPLVRYALVRISDNEHWWLRAIHHIITDAWSSDVFMQELDTLYDAKLRGDPPPLPNKESLQYGDFAVWQQKLFNPEHEAYRAAVQWWSKRLAGAAPVFDLPCRRAVPLAGVSPAEGYLRWGTTQATSKRLGDLGQERDATFFAVRLAAFVAFIGETARQPDVVLGIYMSNRAHVALQRMLGFFVNLATLRINYSDKLSFYELLSIVADEVRGAGARSGIPYDDLRSRLQSSGIESPYIQMIFTTKRRREFYQGQSLSMKKLDSRMVGMPWGFHIIFDEDDEANDCAVNFDAGIYDPRCVRMLVDKFRRFLDAVSTRPNLPLRVTFEWASRAGQECNLP